MDWLELKIDTSHVGLDAVTEMLEQQGVTGVMIDDEADFQSFLENNKLMVNGSGAQLLAELRELYHIDESMTDREARLVAGVRYELHSRDSYTFAEDVS